MEDLAAAGFPEWAEMMDDWGAKMLSALEKSAELLVLGLKLPKGAFAELMENGPHLLGPTGQPASSLRLHPLLV